MKNVVAISIRSIARHERDHCGRPELAGVIEGAANEIDRLSREIDLLRAGIADDGLNRVALQTVARTLQYPAVPTPEVIEWAQKVIRERSRHEQKLDSTSLTHIAFGDKIVGESED